MAARTHSKKINQMTSPRKTTDNYPISLVYLMHSVIQSDGLVHDDETSLMNKIHLLEHVPNDVSRGFESDMERLNAKEIYDKGIRALKSCSPEEQRRTLAWVYATIEADGKVDVKEARFLLYAMNSTAIRLEEITEIAKELPKV